MLTITLTSAARMKSTTRELEESKPKLLGHSFTGGQFAILSDVMTMRLTFCLSCLSAR
ncbi:hypothetical protein TNCV_861801 [Trichonephila clavipes]|nr:hypothetical protein TNCV_861801 [Trichonephila clavipes]